MPGMAPGKKKDAESYFFRRIDLQSMGEGFAFGGEGIGAAVGFAVYVINSPCGGAGKQLADSKEVWTKRGDSKVIVARDAVDNKLRISVDVKILEVLFAGLEQRMVHGSHFGLVIGAGIRDV